MRPPTARSYRWLFWCLALTGFVLDQASKYGIFSWLYDEALGTLQREADRDLIPGAFKLVAQFTGDQEPGGHYLSPLRSWGGEVLPKVNHGALFGLGGTVDHARENNWFLASPAVREFWQNLSGDTQYRGANMLFALVSVVAAVAILFWSTRRHTAQDFGLCVALGLILAGTFGNLYDRVVFHGVRDFLWWYYGVDWPVFNIADCCLVCGAFLLLIQAFRSQPVPADQEAPAETVASPQPVAAGAELATAAAGIPADGRPAHIPDTPAVQTAESSGTGGRERVF